LTHAGLLGLPSVRSLCELRTVTVLEGMISLEKSALPVDPPTEVLRTVVARRCEPIPVIIGRTPERSKPALLAAKVPALLEDPSGEKPALLTAKVLALLEDRLGKNRRSSQQKSCLGKNRRSSLQDVSAVIAPSSAMSFNMVAASSTSAPPHLTPYRPTHVTARIPSKVGKRSQWQERQWPWPPLAQDREPSRTPGGAFIWFASSCFGKPI
jgi:hypothetical protein